MSSQSKGDQNLVRALTRCLDDEEYRRAFVNDPLKAIDTHNLGFQSGELSEESKRVLRSLDANDVENFKRLYQKFKEYGLGDICKAL